MRGLIGKEHFLIEMFLHVLIEVVIIQIAQW